MTTAARLLLATLTLGLLATITPAPAQAAEAHVTACRVEGRTTTVTTTTGVDRYRDLTIARAPFPGTRTIVRTRPGWRRTPTVTACRVLASGTVTVRTPRARLAYTPAPAATEAPLEVAVEVPARPAAVARWTTPTTVYAPIGADWQATAAVAAWNAALPSDRRITIVDQPCSVPTCMTLTVRPRVDVDGYAGLAHWAYDATARVMFSCNVSLSEEVLVEDRPGVVVHELGHCLGLPHWDHAGSAMSSTTAYLPAPSAVDLAWVADTYTATQE